MRTIAPALALLSVYVAGCNRQPQAKPEAEVSSAAATAAEAEEEARASGEADLPAPPDVAAPPSDAERSATGLASKVVKAGQGRTRPTPYDKVRVHYSGWTTEGAMFDSSHQRGQPRTVGLGEVIPGWKEGLQLMVVGETRRMWVPPNLAYQDAGPPGTLVFDVELLEIIPGTPPPRTPDDVGAVPKTAEVTSSGLAHRRLAQGTGTRKPRGEDRVTLSYTGWTSHDGQMFYSTRTRGLPESFVLNQGMPGLGEGVQLMVEGEERRFWVPQALAFGGLPGKPAGMLVFDVELLKIERPPKAPAVPDDVSGPPRNAKKTQSGLRYRVLKTGTGKHHPTARDRVTVHYSGWTTDGKMFDSSAARGEAMTLGMSNVIPGWREGLQLMVEGETTRFWIPPDLAYAGRPGKPQGTLVFDVELIGIVRAPGEHVSKHP